jgi:hypothetical protein
MVKWTSSHDESRSNTQYSPDRSISRTLVKPAQKVKNGIECPHGLLHKYNQRRTFTRWQSNQTKLLVMFYRIPSGIGTRQIASSGIFVANFQRVSGAYALMRQPILILASSPKSVGDIFVHISLNFLHLL